jgi:DNA-binding NarL/FixJ family response regulator
MLVDDHAVVREGYRRLLEMEPGMLVDAEHGDADAAIGALERGALPDVMVLDLSMPGRSGLEVLRHVAQRVPQVAVLVFTMHASPALVKQALRVGARGFVTKNSEPLWLVQAVRRVADGECPVLSPDVAHAAGDAAPPRLTPRELEVLHLLLQGCAVDEIGQRMNLSHKTVANYQTLIRQKLGASTGIELLRAAQRLELTPP